MGWVANARVAVMKKRAGLHFRSSSRNRIGKILKISICYNFICGDTVVVVCFVG